MDTNGTTWWSWGGTSWSSTTSPFGSASADGTTITAPTTSAIVDSDGHQFSFGAYRGNATNYYIMLNGVPLTYLGLAGFALYKDSNVYFRNTNNGDWTYYVPHLGQFTFIAGDPRIETQQGVTSAQSAASPMNRGVIDGSRNFWTFGAASGSDYKICKNNVQVGSTVGVLFLYWNHTVYIQDHTGAWFDYNGTTFVSTSDPRSTESANGTRVFDTTGNIILSGGTVVTLSAAGGTGTKIKFNGTTDTTTNNVVLCMYWNHILYQHDNVLSGWWHGTSGSWSSQMSVTSSGTTITDATGIMLDNNANLITLTASGGHVVFNGVTDTTTSSVDTVLFYNNNLYYENASSVWFQGTQGSWTQIAGDPRVTPGKYTISSGLIKDPSGTTFYPKGIALLDSMMGSVSASNIISLFPNVNAIMLACGADGATGGYVDAQSNASIESWVNDATNTHGLVVVISDYMPGQPTVRTGTDLTNAMSWYAGLASAFATNPKVWWTTENEVKDDGAGGLTNYHVSCYNAVRNAGNNGLIFMEGYCGNPGNGSGGGGNGTTGLSSSTYSNMTGVGFNIHCYPWAYPGYSAFTGKVQADFDTASEGFASAWRSYATSLDGVMPVIMGEGGNSTSGNNTHYDDLLIGSNFATVQSVIDATGSGTNNFVGWFMWLWNWQNEFGSTGEDDTLVYSGALTGYGTQVKNAM